MISQIENENVTCDTSEDVYDLPTEKLQWHDILDSLKSLIKY